MENSRRIVYFSQALIETGKDDVECEVTVVPYEDLKYEDLEAYFEIATPLGLSAAFWKESVTIAAFAIVDAERALVIEFPQPNRRALLEGTLSYDTDSEAYQSLSNVLTRDVGEFFAFDLAPLAMILHSEQGLVLKNAIDVQSAFPDENRYSITAIIKAALGEETKMYEQQLARAFNDVTYDPDSRTAALEPVKRAWLAQHLGSVDDAVMTYSNIKRINTFEMNSGLLEVIAKVTIDSQRLERKKPERVNRDFEYRGYDSKNEEHGLASRAFKNRFRGTEEVRVVVEDASGSFAARGKVDAASGRLATFSDNGLGIGNRHITSIIGIGRSAPTAAEVARDRSLLRLLQGLDSPDNSWLQNIWFNKDASAISWPDEWFSNATKYPTLPTMVTESLTEDAKRLNPSQQIAVNAMLSKNSKNVITIIQGPPGTGKTSVIAFFVQMAIALGKKGIWLVAQSNVAVKNIAEKLSKVGFHDYRLLVSEDFIAGWHEHLYGYINANIIRSAEFQHCGTRIKGVKVFLCTLSMLSSPSIQRIFSREFPITTLVVDEASQIHVADYISVFYKYPSIRKACFIGDDKQLPPFGQDDSNPDALPSIFEFDHLRGHAYFLNTQYRMPPQMGELISNAVYESQLNSNPHHSISNQIMACHFVDVPGSTEKRKNDSFMNEGECEVVFQIAKYLQDNKHNYKIISPYDAQRIAIETKMRTSPEGLKWENTCFNVDSFQGNEEDYIIVSLVRSREIGFLKSLRRTNVMLTRFKCGMFVVSSKKFLSGIGRECLVGEIAAKVGSAAWLDLDGIAKGEFFGPRRS
ncbi:hypothetical protein NP233_g4370 [Leucocoprinus birnbaumii]|uniref:DNA2/NAM7 helicase-like C-terminal domain-containing protein n=1 Tax=Leucocoprinus birnbaumii TaxID=56174 RepID=A0AAD5VVG6_9AGAR|nr:hypothetical protein NP233_g4370 [Leucocoprinus birnbaumii]